MRFLTIATQCFAQIASYSTAGETKNCREQIIATGVRLLCTFESFTRTHTKPRKILSYNRQARTYYTAQRISFANFGEKFGTSEKLSPSYYTECRDF